MSLIVLHDHINTTQEVLVESKDIVSVVPYGSGSVINGTIGVCETVEQVQEAIADSQGN